MFEGSVSEQLHQFLTPRTTPQPPPPNSNSLPLIPLNFALHSPNFNFHPFEHSYNNPTSTTTTTHHHHQIHLHHPHQFLHQSSNGNEKDDDETTTTVTGNNLQVAMDLEVGGRENNHNNNRSILMEDHHIIHHDEWSNDELLSLLRIRSNIENCFPESTWEHVSRKLGEVGFRRTAEKCKEKFEEESRYFNHINYNKSCRFLTHELNYHHHHQDHLLSLIHNGNGKPDDAGPANVIVVPEEGEEDQNEVRDGELQDEEEEEEEEEEMRNDETRAAGNEEELDESSRSRSWKKRKRKRKMMRQMEFELLKGYCEEIVKKMMSQQEEIHSKLLQDMLKKEEEKVAKEESWKKQQMEKLHKELEVMAHEQAIAGDRQATIIEILNQITNSTTLISSSTSKKDLQNLLKSLNNYNNNNNNNNIPTSIPSSSSLIQTQTSTPNIKQQISLPPHENSSSFTSPQNDPIKNPKNPCLSTKIPSSQDPNSFIIQSNPKIREKDHEVVHEDLGKRWPKDEVLALVNVRCKIYNTNNNNNIQDESQSVGVVSLKAPLWERISQGMLELGYKRSAKRCKEKWENINKYFRKTKDVNKKRSVDSRTCPYFHQLTTLYNQGGANNRPENHSDGHSENHLATSS